MKKYVIPQIELLLFDEEEVLTESSVATYADKLIQQYTFGEQGYDGGVGVKSSISIQLQDINTSLE